MRTVNNFTQFLAAPITDLATTITIDGNRSRLGTPGDSRPVVLTLTDRVNQEIVYVTGRGSGDQEIEVKRGMENTTARSWLAGTRIEARPTAALFADPAVQYETLTSGNVELDMGNNPTLVVDGIATANRAVTVNTPLDDQGVPMPGRYTALIAVVDRSGDGATDSTSLFFSLNMDARLLSNPGGQNTFIDNTVGGGVWRINLLVAGGKEFALYEALAW